MSSLTKVLIILITVASLLLSGMVVSFVTISDDYKAKADSYKKQADQQKAQARNAKKELDEAKSKFISKENKFTRDLGNLRSENDRLKRQYENLKSEKEVLAKRMETWGAVTNQFTQTNEKQGDLLAKTQADLDEIRKLQIEQQKELKETTTTLIEKMAVIEALTTDKKRLEEKNMMLQNKLDNLLLPAGRTAVAQPVTPERTRVTPVTAPTATINLTGVVKDFDAKHDMAMISIGRADGVKEGMRFHVIRNKQFICDIRIVDVEPEQAVGTLELVQKKPVVGDKVATNF